MYKLTDKPLYKLTKKPLYKLTDKPLVDGRVMADGGIARASRNMSS